MTDPQPDLTQEEANRVFAVLQNVYRHHANVDEMKLVGPHKADHSGYLYYEIWWDGGQHGWSRMFVDEHTTEGRMGKVFMEPVAPVDPEAEDEVLVLVRSAFTDTDARPEPLFEISPQAAREAAVGSILDVRVEDWKAWLKECYKPDMPIEPAYLASALDTHLGQYINSLFALNSGTGGHNEEKLMVQALAVLCDEALIWVAGSVKAFLAAKTD